MGIEADKERRAQTWLAFASAAVAGLSGTYEFDAEDDDQLDADADDIADIASAIADKMTVEFEARFMKGARKPKPKARRRDELPEADEDE